jgi:hypothetical protein
MSEYSLLFSEQGWIDCGHAGENSAVAGIDRHGKLATASVSLRRTGKASQSVFFGSARCCGWLGEQKLVPAGVAADAC